MITAKEKISKVVDNWFMNEPLLFDIFCTHKLEETDEIKIPFRTGKRKIQYNPDIVQNITQKNIEQFLKIEVLRIILKHPYQRVPANPNRAALSKASDITISENCFSCKNLCDAKYYNFSPNLSFEEYYKQLELICPPNGSGTKYKEAEEESELWSEDEEICDEINSSIERAERTNKWGSLSGSEKEIIMASLKIPMDYRRILSQFRACIISQRRKLTRMKPNRRYDFDYMGSQFEPKTRLLVAVDVSGSICEQDMSNFFSIINRFFNYGVEEITVLTFDTEIKQQMEFKKAAKEVRILGRGGTDFQCVIDFYQSHYEYQGLIVFTDGYANIPKVKKNKQICWIFTDKQCYEYSKEWVKKLKYSKATYIPSKKSGWRY